LPLRAADRWQSAFRFVRDASGWILRTGLAAIASVALPLTVRVVGVTVTMALAPLMLFTRMVAKLTLPMVVAVVPVTAPLGAEKSLPRWGPPRRR
jgi:hypothetical protein